jgi:hypothetical protein
MTRYYGSRRSRTSLAVGAGAALLALAGWTVAHHPSAQAARPGPPTSQAQGRATTAPTHPDMQHQDQPDAEQDLTRLRAVTPVTVESPPPAISGDQVHQPDLYAAEFVRRLLTQNYRAPRQAHLAWVQAESAQSVEPLVVGLVPADLRDRLAVYSVTDTADGPGPVPTEQEWRQLGAAKAYTTVQIQRVTEPLAWTNAVADGRITDPGVTGREVAALVTRHTNGSGASHAQRFSVDLTLNLEGPPTRATWGFVTAVTYTSIPIGAP